MEFTQHNQTVARVARSTALIAAKTNKQEAASAADKEAWTDVAIYPGFVALRRKLVAGQHDDDDDARLAASAAA